MYFSTSSLLLTLAACFLMCCCSLLADEERDADRLKLEAKLAEIEAGAEKNPLVIKAKESITALAERIGKAERIEVFRLDPRHPDDQLAAKRRFHGREILAEARTESADLRKEISEFVGASLHWNELRIALCFNPRHGLRVVSGKETLDLVICFECFRVDAYEGDKLIKTYALTRQKGNPLEKMLPKANEKAKDPR